MINSDKTQKLNSNKRAQLWLGIFVLFIFIACSSRSKQYAFTGNTMGTTYSVKIVSDDVLNTGTIKIRVDSVFSAINMQMSTYIENSEINLFNNRNNSDWQTISPEFYKVLENALEISELTNGAFDITIGPLVELWGFGTTNNADWLPPIEDKINQLIDRIGYQKLELQDSRVRKSDPNINIDLNAIAKGFGVDAVFDLLLKMNQQNILVEIGGEIRCLGLNINGKHWTVGIDKPIFNILPGTELESVISLNNCALATSGDYRQFFYYEDKLYSHTIDPATGKPIENGIASASVIAPNCTIADGLATALMVLGVKGLEIIEQINDTEALVIERINENEFKDVRSSGWVNFSDLPGSRTY